MRRRGDPGPEGPGTTGAPPAHDATGERAPIRDGGLTSAEVRRLLASVGPNASPVARTSGWLRKLVAQLTHLLALLLWGAAGLALLSGTPALALAIVVIIVLNGAFAFAQEYRADRSAERLRDLVPARARAVRDGRVTLIAADELVPGDLVVLQAGDRVGADLDMVRGGDLLVDESLVTGESAAVRRVPGTRLTGGTFVVQGEGEGVVVATGARTTLAGIGRLTAEASRPASPLTQELRRVVRVVASVGAGLGLVCLGLGLGFLGAALFAIGVAVALVPEGLLPTVTLSLARGAERMSEEGALIRRLDAVETLGATTFVCTDKTGTLTQNRMNAVEVVTVAGAVSVKGEGYEPIARIDGSEEARAELGQVSRAALRCVMGRVVRSGDRWVAEGDPMEAALHCLALRAGCAAGAEGHRRPYSPDRRLSSSLNGELLSVLGAPEAVFERCGEVPAVMMREVTRLADAGRRVLAVASRPASATGETPETSLDLLGLVALEDPPREGVCDALTLCRSAGIRLAMITGDHPRTAAAIGHEVGLLGPSGVVVDGRDLPASDAHLADLIDLPDGVVIARATPGDKLRIARALRSHGHVVAMTGDGVNDAPALREADVGVAMGAGGSDVAREAADVVLLDDHFATIVSAIRLGRATFSNVRRFLTFHLTDNVAELAPFVVWALTAGQVPLAIGVLQVLALDIGSDILPALALGAEPARADAMRGPRRGSVVDGALLARAFLVLGLTEAVLTIAAFLAVLLAGGWRWGMTPGPTLLAQASGSAFAAIVLGQAGNALACRSTTRPVWRLRLRDNPAVLWAIGAQLALLVVFLGVAPFVSVLGGAWPTPLGWMVAAATAALVMLVDATFKVVVLSRRSPTQARTTSGLDAPRSRRT